VSRGVTIDLIVDPKGAINGLNIASGESSKFTGLLGDLGRIGATAVAAVATAAVAAAGALTAATVSAGKYADEILEAATKTNLGTDELQAYRYAAEQMDVSFETFTSSQGRMVKAMESATSGAGPAAEAFSALGLSVTDSSGNLVDSTDLYWQAIDALGSVTNETERTALAQQIFGKSGAEMNAIIAKGSEGFRALSEEARRNGAIMSGEQLEALGAFDDKMQGLTSTVDAAKNALGLTLLPILDQLAGEGGSALGEFSASLLEADGNASKIGPAFETLGTNIAGVLSTAIPKILQVGTSLVSGLVQGIVTQAPKLIQTAVPLIVTFVTGILGMLPAILDAGLKILIALVQGIATALPQLIPAAVEAILGLVTALVDNLPLLIDAGIELLLGVALGLIEALPQLVEKIPTLIASIVTALVGAIPQLVMAGVKLFVALVSNLPAIISGILMAIPTIMEALVGAFKDPKFWQQMGDAGLQLIRGLWEGIKGAGDWLWKQISGFFGDVIKNIQALFGIRSPSTVFAGFGDFMIQGLEKGLTGPNNLGAIMSDLSRQVAGGFGASLDVQARAAVIGPQNVAGMEAATAPVSAPQVNQTIYMLPEQDARITGRQFGREFARAMAGVR
jgi:hypothetical protein